MTTILAAGGALLGLGGLILGGCAFRYSRTALGDSRSLARRQFPETGGIDVRAIRDVAVVRYDALEEMSGARSFSLAILNAAGNGVVITSINGRTESRTYAKTIEGGEAAEALSPEEYRAIRAARLGQGPRATTPMDDSSNVAAMPGPSAERGEARGQPHTPGGVGPSVRPLGRFPDNSARRSEVPETAT
nr:DUF4446 family protein [Allosalinactinospora lopnorensis]